MSEGVKRIAAERERQIKEEYWALEHDDDHTDGSLAMVASLYAKWSTYAADRREYKAERRTVPKGWPRSWLPHWWKPSTPIRDLEKAGALIAAEIDRRLRAGEKS